MARSGCFLYERAGYLAEQNQDSFFITDKSVGMILNYFIRRD